MSAYYNGKRTKNIFDPLSKEPFKLSRSKIELFMNCPLCFYLDRRLGVGQPQGFPFNLNSAVDHLLKKEFDIHRAQDQAHPLMKHYGLDAVPFSHEKLDEWRENFKGVQYHHAPTNLLITGAVDDIWVHKEGELIVVDYKSTSKDTEVNLDADWQDGYKRQMEIYQWLLRKNGFSVSSTGYFVYCNGKRDAESFDAKLEFDIKLIPYTGNDGWVEQTLFDLYRCLLSDTSPKESPSCDYCAYRKAARDVQLGKTLNFKL
ncbi:PD-(D/E)XK nuclease family protein [Candidatus Uhrbacteria bacterium]|nr:PD-(D/E)XK nuclease family protein [Candidatus Uhrbacteria bacterium]